MSLGEPPRDDDTIGSYFAQVIERQPDRLAIVTIDAVGRDRLTFGELGAAAGGLAHAVAEVSPQGPVIALPADGIDLALGVFAAVGAGRPVVAIDPALPAERIAELAQLAGAHVAVGSTGLDVPGLVMLRPGDVAHRPFEPANVDRDAPFSVSFTSGSTGRPKPVSRTQRWILDTLHEANLPHQPIAGDHIGMMLSVTGVVTTSLTRALLNGLTFSVFDPRQSSISAITLALRDHGVTLVRLVPSILRRIVEAAPAGFCFDTMRVVWAGGEPLRWSDVAGLRPLLPERCIVVHQYGSSELGAVAYKVITHDQPLGSGAVPIGRPVDDLDVWVDAGDGTPAAVGVTGEMVVDGARVGMRTGAQLQGGPLFEALADGRWRFRTGDAVRLRHDGDLEHLGRLDRMLKIGGTRIEPVTVEDALRRASGVADVAVVAATDGEGEAHLVAHVVVAPGAEVTATDLRRVARARLPAAAVPARFVVSDDPLPLLESGKVDLSKFADLDDVVPGRDGPLVPPVDDLERHVAECMAEVLGLAEVGAVDDFFALGGDSLRAQRLCALMVRRKLGDLPASSLLRAPTVRQLAEIIRGGSAEVWHNLLPLRTEGTRPPLVAVHAVHGHGLLYGALADHLGPEQPVYALQAEALSGRRPRSTTVEQIAASYREQVEQRLPDGPYLLFGFSFGGTVAFEMARQLLERGRPVEMLVLGDTVNSSQSEGWMFPRITLRGVWRGDRTTRRRNHRLHNRVLIAVKHMAHGAVVRVSFMLGRPVTGRYRRWLVATTHRRANSRYLPTPLPLRMVMLRSTQQDERPARGWEGFADEIDCFHVDSRHGAMLREPAVAQTAALLRDEIDRVCERLGVA